MPVNDLRDSCRTARKRLPAPLRALDAAGPYPVRVSERLAAEQGRLVAGHEGR